MFITYEKFKIRNAVPEDSNLLCQWWNDGAIMAHAGFPYGLNTNAQVIALSLSSDSDDTYRRLIIEVDAIPIGEMNYRNKGNGTAEIGIKICDSQKQEKGYGTTFLKLFISRLFADGYTRIVLDTNLNNTRAQHVYEKIGFQKLRINHNAWNNQLGEPQSSVDYELLSSQFASLPI
jgi:RimJ/RimL family protein N-acetyltransferase